MTKAFLSARGLANYKFAKDRESLPDFSVNTNNQTLKCRSGEVRLSAEEGFGDFACVDFRDGSIFRFTPAYGEKDRLCEFYNLEFWFDCDDSLSARWNQFGGLRSNSGIKNRIVLTSNECKAPSSDLRPSIEKQVKPLLSRCIEHKRRIAAAAKVKDLKALDASRIVDPLKNWSPPK